MEKIKHKLIESVQLPEINYAFHKTVSYSQFSVYQKCPYRWYLQYNQKIDEQKPSINMTFGTAIHESLQKYLEIMYSNSGKAADEFDIESFFQERFIEVYRETTKQNKDTHFSSADEMREFFEDGLAIIQFFKKNRIKYFSIKNSELVGIEIPLVLHPNKNHKNVLFKGFIDFILYNKLSDTYTIYDIKTSGRGWKDTDKKDADKLSQIILYKEYFANLYNVDVEKIEVEFFIVKRKIWEESEYPQSRIQEFIPASGKNKRKSTVETFNNFLKECFDSEGNFTDRTYYKNVSKNCKYCPFQNKQCDKIN
jgi:hypothetical protein